MKTGKLTTRFQLTLPKEFVDKLGLEPGQAVLYELKDDGILVSPLVPLRKANQGKKKGG